LPVLVHAAPQLAGTWLRPSALHVSEVEPAQ
jgi:hypothetical protein